MELKEKAPNPTSRKALSEIVAYEKLSSKQAGKS